MKTYKLVTFLSLLFLLGLVTIIQATSETIKYANPVYDIWDNTTKQLEYETQALSESTWTQIDSELYDVIEFESIYETIVCIATSTANADIAFAANEYEILAASTAYEARPRQGSSVYNIYAKCWASNDKSDTLDNAAAVNKSTTPATVGIPITGHSFLAGDFVTIAGVTVVGATAYNGTYRVYSKSADEIVIFSAYTAVTFDGTETAVSAPTYLIKTAK